AGMKGGNSICLTDDQHYSCALSRMNMVPRWECTARAAAQCGFARTFSAKLAADIFRDSLLMEVTIFPNPRRPGIGLRPKKEAQRPLLPQHARLCPVLEAGSSLGALVYPSLAENEQFHIGYEGEGLYQFGYSVNPTGKKWEQIFFVNYQLSMGAIGMKKE